MKEELKPGTILRQYRERLEEIEKLANRAVILMNRFKTISTDHESIFKMIELLEKKAKYASVGKDYGVDGVRKIDERVSMLPHFANVTCSVCGKKATYQYKKPTGQAQGFELLYYCAECLKVEKYSNEDIERNVNSMITGLAG